MTRILTAAIGVPLLLVIILAGSATLFVALVLGVALAAYRELARLMADVGGPPLPVGYLVVAVTTLAFHPRFPLFQDLLPVAAIVIGVAAVLALGPVRGTNVSIAATVFGAFYLGAPLGSVVWLRTAPTDHQARLWVIFLLAVIMMGDACAFYAGRALGKHRLAPVLSPKKTIEGLAGGLLGSVVTAAALQASYVTWLSPARALALGFVLSLSGVLGDLFESLLKRSAGVKDTSHLLPGHGGLLDRIDSLLFAAPVLFVYVKWTS
ncbi:MAG TPA: phosphatidate cytidylyltransferase [Vicinamibacteria bacterium]|nr:phosphatidate cytidylyltransferase [Vicinamibacteria bacterium]